MNASPNGPEVDGYAQAAPGLMLHLAARVFSDAPPRLSVPAAYIFGQTPDNEGSVLKAAARLIASNSAELLLIPESRPWSGYGGDAHWRSVLPALGVPPERIASVPTRGFDNRNTLTEAMSLAGVVAAAGWRDLSILAPPFHLLRAFVTTASVFTRRLPDVRVYAAAGLPQPWLDPAVHSQGTLRAPRSELLGCEFDRLVRYRRKGDLLGPGEILAYLDRRDAVPG